MHALKNRFKHYIKMCISLMDAIIQGFTESEGLSQSECLEETLNKEENKRIFKRCTWCEIEFTWSDFWEHHDECKVTNSISALDIHRNRKYIKNGKMYVVSDIERVIRRNRDQGRCTPVNSIFVRLYCDEDQTSIRYAFNWNRRFRVDENKHIIIE
jgi:hypothetical protein